MIDENKVEKAAKYYAEENSMSIEEQMGDTYDGIEELSDAYKAGAKWAINEFLEDLWHETDEKPVPIIGCNNSVLVELNETRKPITLWKRECLYENISKHGNRFVSRWLDVNDLLKGSENEKE